MSFTASLMSVFKSADVISINGHKLKEENFLPHALGKIFIYLIEGEYNELDNFTALEFSPQNVKVNDAGEFTAITSTGETVTCIASAIKPLTESDLIKENPSTDLAVNTALSNLTFDTDTAKEGDSKDFTFTQVVFAGDEALYGIGERTSGEGFQIDVLDEAKKNGSVTLEIGSTESSVDDYVSLTTTVATLPGTNLLVPRFHVEGTISGVELDIFQSKSGFLMRLPEEQELIMVITADGEVLYSVGKKSK